jgi:hypothetical protein
MVGSKVLLSNALRNLGVHLASPIGNLNHVIENGILKVHEVIGLDASDSRTTWGGTKFQLIFTSFEELAGNPLHLLLIFLAFPLILYSRERLHTLYVLCMTASALLFALLLKWQPWIGRLHLPLFIVAMPIVAVTLSKKFGPRVASLVMLILMAVSIPYVALNPSHLLIGPNNVFLTDRYDQYFALTPDLALPYRKTANALAETECRRIGLLSRFGDIEYPIWAALDFSDDILIENIMVDNASRALESGFIPCALIATYPIQSEMIVYKNIEFVETIKSNSINLYTPWRKPQNESVNSP